MDKPHFPDGKPQYTFVNPQAPKGGTFAIGAVGIFDGFYPFLIQGHPAAGIGMLWATLFTRAEDEPGVTYPYLAESVAIKGQKVTFRLRKEACFSDGSKVRPEDVVFSFALLRKHHFPMPGYYAFVQDVRKTGTHEVTFSLAKEGSKENVTILSELPIFSEAFFADKTIEDHPLTLPLGNGPYKIVSFIPGKRVVYEKVEHWWGANLPINRGAYHFQRLIYEYFRDPLVMFEAFKGGKLDVFSENSAKNWFHNYAFDAVKKGRIIKEEIPKNTPALHVGLVFNTRRPLFADSRVRRAMSMMVDFDAMNRQFFHGTYKRTTSFFQNTPFAAEGMPSKEERDFLEKHHAPKESYEKALNDITIIKATPKERRHQALSLLQEAGFSPHHGILKDPHGKPVQFTLLLADTSLARVLHPFVQALESIGMRVFIRVMDPVQYMSSVKKFDFDMVYGSLSTTGDQPGNELLSTVTSESKSLEGSYNFAGIADPLIDRIVGHILKAKTLKELRFYAHVLDRLLMASHYAIPTFHYPKERLAYWHTFAHPTHFPRSGNNFSYWWQKKPTPIQ